MAEALSQLGLDIVLIVKWLLDNGSPPAAEAKADDDHLTGQNSPSLPTHTPSSGLADLFPAVSDSEYPALDYVPPGGIPPELTLDEFCSIGDLDYRSHCDVPFTLRGEELHRQHFSVRPLPVSASGIRSELQRGLQQLQSLKRDVCTAPRGSERRRLLNVRLFRLTCQLITKRSRATKRFAWVERYLEDAFRRKYGMQTDASFDLPSLTMSIHWDNEYPFARRLFSESRGLIPGTTFDFDDATRTVRLIFAEHVVLRTDDDRFQSLWKRYERLQAIMSEEVQTHQELEAFDRLFDDMPDSFKKDSTRVEHRKDLGRPENEIGSRLRLKRFWLSRGPNQSSQAESAGREAA